MQESLLILVVTQPSGMIAGSSRIASVDEQGRTLTLTPPPPDVDHVAVAVDEKGVPVDPAFAAVLADPNHPDSGPRRWRFDAAQPWTQYSYGDSSDLIETTDPRLLVRLTQIPNPGLVGQLLTIRLEVLDTSDDVRTDLNRSTTIQVINQDGNLRRWVFVIRNGIAERILTPTESGELDLLSDQDEVHVFGDNPVVIDETG